MSRLGDLFRKLRGKPRRQGSGAMPTVRYATSPLLASRTPPWRVKFLIGAIGLGFAVLIGRAAWIQIVHNDFYLQQGASRYERRIELQANRGRILDRNGLILASSVPSPMIALTLTLYVTLYLALIVAYVAVLKYMAEKPVDMSVLSAPKTTRALAA